MISKDRGIDALTGFAEEAVRGAGQEAMAYYGKGRPDIKFDEDLVTRAELHLNEFFQDRLLERFPDHEVFRNTPGETAAPREGKHSLWIYDPLDGVANFQAGIPVWGMSLALLENFWPVLGMFHMPVTGDLFQARADGGAFRNGLKIHVGGQGSLNDESLLLTYSRIHREYETTFPGKIRSLGCGAAHICYVAMGRAEAALVANESYQDLAAACIIVKAAGGKIFRMDGNKFFISDYLDGERADEHLLVAAPEMYPLVRKCLRKKSR